MKVLILSRKDLFTKKGGDTVQVLNIISGLKALGLTVSLNTDKKEKFDLVHIFNSYNVDEALENLQIGRKFGKKVILTPIYHSEFFLKDMLEKYSDRKRNLLYRLLKFDKYMTINMLVKQLSLKNFYSLKRVHLTYKQKLQMLFNKVDFIIPNSELEMEYILKEVPFLEKVKYKVAHNGMDVDRLNVDMSTKRNNFLFDDYLVSIGRIEPLKNQINIIEGFKRSNLYKNGFKLYFCGAANGKSYFKRFKRLVDSDDQLVHVGFLPQDDLFEIINQSKGLVHASWFETTGLIGLEAGLFKKPILMTNKGYTKSYFKSYVEYCQPDEIQTITEGLDKLGGINEDRLISFNKEITQKYNWPIVSKEIKNIYQTIIKEDA
jgi:glycosyltransferase involved in cell wall biosynthesis